MFGVGATMLGVPELAAKDAPRREPIRLEQNGWLKQPAREIPVVAEADAESPRTYCFDECEYCAEQLSGY